MTSDKNAKPGMWREAISRTRKGGLVGLIAGEVDDRILLTLTVGLVVLVVVGSNYVGFWIAFAVAVALAAICGLILRYRRPQS